MKLVKGKLDYRAAQVQTCAAYLFTGNSYVNKAGELVMGRGAAAEVKALYPNLPAEFGRQITERGLHMGEYGMLWSGNIGVLQVKYHFREEAQFSLIGAATTLLAAEAIDAPFWTFHVNFPGIGFGGLDRDKVLPMLLPLPDNVIVYEE